MSEPEHPVWVRHLNGIAEELMRLTIACDVRLRDPGVVDRIIKNDASVCGKRNAIGFGKLRSLVIGTYSSLNKAIDAIGPEQTRLITDAIAERVQELHDSKGFTAATPGQEAGEVDSGESP
ncbi:MAG: hypothetical protein OEW68_16125 [Gammaproteobacteria bacterium]|nr:hypothetical protein [Gammaproteobacteria bacterium]MDH4316349.1 hypothetical protein [Gammaproteobacteria bacterium]MDH5215478.1 hypothetical protein [Gammaproteobacteria bacterium]MDH5500351.1 hypothetical protein [Gammaproteobacteria bacterium]